ncbi:mitochondrial protein from FMP27 domain-containing protein [Trichoderma breve]|uniref:Mitochondrial protein from FMP27 domain-containing protein n=1 Tax=Trichoderma breve TaxID=2034170 RepID=A0A9W9B951_9HYPO|nr:mitochondrial protein from FMP27 domain-containing protein [Trichoderma breve]KAJ4855296.1 mitochondrial protein from FMP27 domain-containing protein [Trichoderma breve]
MALLSPTFALGVFVLLYLSSFVLFAVLRIVTGISIQRIGYFSLRRLAYSPRDGIRIEIRGLGLNIHRPTFAQPTWLSIVLSDLTVTADIKKLEERKPATDETPQNQAKARAETETWSRLQKLKEKVKKLHHSVKWLRLVDVVVTNSVINVVDVGSLQVGSLTLAVDTRHKMADRARFFFHRSDSSKEHAEAEWILTVRSVFFAVDGKESLQILDHALLNVHGYLYPTQEGLRDATVALKLGRVQIPYDELHHCATKFKLSRKKPKVANLDDPVDIFVSKVQDGTASSANEHLMKTVSDSKEFFSSILRGIKEIQFAVSFVGLVKKVESVNPCAKPVHLTASMKEVGIDLHRLDPKSPAHRMYFPSTDIAHEALVAALSISVGMDDGLGKPQRIVYIPMATTTVRTTLPSKTIQLSQVDDFEDKNANILFANSVVTSPSIDLDPRHLPLLIAMMRSRPKPPKTEQRQQQKYLFSRLLPKASIKFTMHEPVLRIKLKPLGKTEDPDDYGLIISSISSVALDVESSHSPLEDLHYSLDGAMRLQSHHLYYQAVSGERFDLITTESFDLKVHLAANPEVSVDATSNIQSFSVSMVRPEITDGVRQIVRQLRTDVEPTKRAKPKSRRHPNFLRSVPEWLFRYQIAANDVNIEIAGVDEQISDDSKGISLHLDGMSAEYRAQRLDGLQRRMLRRRTHSRSLTQSDSDFASTSPTRSRKKPQNIGDGRRLVFNARGIEAQIIETAEQLELEPFINVPRLEFSLSASSDNHGPLFHIQSSIRSIMVQYSLYRHYAVGVAMKTVRQAFMRTSGDAPRASQQGTPKSDLLVPPTTSGFSPADSASTITDSVVVDVKVALIQVKAEMPHDPMIMLHIYSVDAGRQRWSTPYLSSKLIRLYVASPRMRNIWSRMVSIKNGRLDLRESKHKSNQGDTKEEKLIDVSTEAIRIGIPHEVIVHRITDNIINVIKAVQQLQHRFKTGTNEYILEKKPEGPKSVPKISIRSRNFLFEMEDGAFEWKLGMIYRAGRMEQIQRATREEAFRIKLNRVREEELKRGNNGKNRSRSAFPRGRTENSSSAWFRSRSSDATKQDERSREGRPSAMPRYNPENETLGINGNAKVSVEEARLHLDMFNAQSWKKRIDRAYQVSRDGVKELRGLFWGQNEMPSDVEETENILEVAPRPALMATYISNLHIAVDKPTFPLEDLPDFIYKVGKGMPKDMQYSLLVPMHISIDMGEARCSLRDYPLPLLHIPGLKAGQSSRLQAVSLRTNFVLAEEFRGLESSRRVPVNIIPPKSSDPGASKEGCFAIEVRRTIGPVKSFSDVYMDINTSLPTRITWGPCYQPAIQDMMMVVESFTKPQIDPSERVGFWDKLRLNFHSRIHVAWKEDGDMHFAMKGTRDPYQVTGHGAGFIMCWRNDIKWNINAEDNPKKFMTVDSGEYILAIPDYSMQFKKVVMKLSGRVQWLAGLVFERAIEDGRRSFDFKPHYEVVLKNPLFAKPDENGCPYDAMRGFRSRHIHLSIAVRAPADREWMSQSLEPSRSYNTIHLTPRFFTHFFAWWGLFSGPMSLPIRQGSLFPGREKNSKKFGRHLATVKYNLLFAPLFLSHIYKHKDAEDYSENAVSATGLKVRFDSFMLDLHQRREEFDTIAKTKNSPSRITGIKLHAAHLDLACADIRAVSASLYGTTTEAIKKGSISHLTLDQDEKPDVSRFTIPDGDYSWIDMDDFVELDWILPTEAHPETKILPLAYIPRLTYFRQTDIGGIIAGDPTRTSPFGNEPTHFCTMSEENDPKSVQAHLIKERLAQLDEQIRAHIRHVGEAELKVIRTDSKDHEILEDFDTLRQHSNVLRDKRAFLETMLERMNNGVSTNGHASSGAASTHRSEGSVDSPSDHMDMPSIPSNAEFESEFENRFVIHNMQLKWNNLLRNIVLRYVHQNEQTKARMGKAMNSEPASAANGTPTSPDTPSHEKDAATDLEDRIKDLESGISDEFNPQCSYHVRLIAPQIQLQSEKNKKHVVLVTSKGMELKVVEVMDKSRISDQVSGLVQRRFLVNMDSTQFFVTHQKWFLTNMVSMYAGSKYGTPTGSSWPPWVPMEVMFDFRTDPFGFKRVVQKTSAMLRYDKYNNLRLKYNDEVNSENTDETTEEPTEKRYYAVYVIVLDLLMYSEPLEKTRNERLEKIILGSDFSDLSGIPEMVMKLQDRIRQMEEIKSHFQIYSLHLDKKGWEDRLALERDLAASEDELFFMMKAIMSSQRRLEKNNTRSDALLKWSISVRDIVWHLMQDSNEPLVELQLKNLEYDRTDHSDGSHMNLVRVGKLLGLNLLPDATYPEIITPYHEGERPGTRYGDGDSDMIRVYWYMLEAIAGIPVMDQFEIELFPIKIQLEREVGKRLFEYIFPVRRDSNEADEEGNESPKSTISRTGTSRTLGKKSSIESMRPLTATPRPGVIGRSSTGFSSRDSRDSDSKKSTRFGLRSRHNTEDKQMSDDLTKMIERANNYITFAHIKIPSVVLCLSYKGKDQRNFEDVHNFVFRLPLIEWQNKTWSNLDLALALKKAVVRALISHTGAIIGNKFSKHKPNAEQRNRLRELASSSALISPMSSSLSQNYTPSIHDSDDSASMYGTSPIDYSRSPPRSTRSSIRSGIPAPRSASRSSSITSSRSHLTTGSAQNIPQVPSYLTMTPPTPVDATSRGDGHSSLAIELLRPSSSQGLGSHRHAMRTLSGGSESRPSTSAGHLDKKNPGPTSVSSGGFGLRDKLTALTQRMSHREQPAVVQTDEPEEMNEEEAAASPTMAEHMHHEALRNKRLSWSQSRSKTTG